ncbi:MAG TPA: peptidylprolyl isomerase [Luteitalea sp.]|nr:peptidylprolyl isomerase [Luteitalea sp.]
MRHVLLSLAVAAGLCLLLPVPSLDAQGKAAAPQITIETEKGTIVILTYPERAPKTVGHIVDLVKKNFYNAQRIHRVVKGQLVQWGDKMSRDMTYREWWGRSPGGSSGNPIGVAEFTKGLKHVAGSVSMAHPGNPTAADSQIFICLSPMPNLDGKHVIFGEVTQGLDVARKLVVTDRLKRVSVK